MKNFHINALMVLISFLSFGCESYLDEKADKQLAVANTVADLRALLYHDDMYSTYGSSGELSSDDLFVTDEDLNSMYFESDKRLYTWQPDFVSKGISEVGNNWQDCYKAIYVCNSILDALEKYNLTGTDANELKGQTLVIRAARYLDGLQIWAPIFNAATADKDMGMVIRLDPDMNLPSIRSSVKQTYDQVFKDLTEALPNLPTSSPGPNVPTKAAAYGLFARAYLIIGDYPNALSMAKFAIENKSSLIDFNELNPDDDFPIRGTKIYAPEELIFLTSTFPHGFDLTAEIIKVSTSLYNSYTDGDLRKTIYFQENSDGTYLFKGTHIDWGFLTGITTAEMFLIIAECYARANSLQLSSDAFNTLAKKRWESNAFTPIAFKNKNEAINTVIAERRRELAFRGLRWTDIKRLNRDGGNIIQSRSFNGQQYTLLPNDKKYAIAIPEDIIAISQVKQNPR
jgi:tetratricopeptide (TPR) repeat protein